MEFLQNPVPLNFATNGTSSHNHQGTTNPNSRILCRFFFFVYGFFFLSIRLENGHFSEVGKNNIKQGFATMIAQGF